MSNGRKVDQTESDWTQMFNARYGSGITRRNAAIYVPIVANITLPLNIYNDGSVEPPKPVKEWTSTQLMRGVEPVVNANVHWRETSLQPFACLDTNPNYQGDGKYFPDYSAEHPFYGRLPETSNSHRLTAPAKSREIPIEIRRRLY